LAVLALSFAACSTGRAPDQHSPVQVSPLLERDLPPDDGCSPQTTLSLDDSKAYFPYADGNRWIFRGGNGADKSLFAQDPIYVRDRTVDGTRGVVVDKNPYNSRQTVEHKLEVDDSGVWNHDSVPGVDGPFHEVKFPVQLCSSFEQYHVTLDGSDVDRDGKNDPVEVSATVTVRALEPVVTQLGTFQDALRLERHVVRTTTLSSTGTEDVKTEDSVDWYGKGLGLLKSTASPSATRYRATEEVLIGYSVDGAQVGVLPDGQLIGGLAAANSDGDQPGRPGIASDGQHFLVAATKIPNSRSLTGDIVGLLVSAQGVVEKTFPIIGNVQLNVKIDATFDGNNYLVVIAGQDGFRGVRIAPDGTALGQPFTIYAGVTGAPAIAAGGGSTLVAYTKWDSTTYQQHLYATLISPTGTLSPEILVSGVANATAPAAAYDGSNFFVVWEDRRNAHDIDEDDIYGARISATGELVDPAGLAITTTPPHQTDPHVAFDGTNYVVAWFDSKEVSFIGDGDIRGARLGVDGTLLDGPAASGGFAISANEDLKGHPRVIAFAQGSLVVWEVPQFTRSAVAGIYGTRLSVNGALLDGPASDTGLVLSGPPSDYSRSVFPVAASTGDSTMIAWLDNIEAAGASKAVRASLLFPW
jgi:hypothetical protein